MILRPVLMRITERESPRGPQRLERQRRYARAALRKCAELSGAPTDGWRQSDERVPIPNGDFHWSIAHKRSWVAAVIADRPVGIDIEHVAPRKTDLFDVVATPQEWSLACLPSPLSPPGGEGRMRGIQDSLSASDQTWSAFFRIWTAKEATLKANGVGIGRLDDCRLIQIVNEHHVVTLFADREWSIEHYEWDGHLAAVTSGHDEVRWHIVEEEVVFNSADE